MVPLNAATLLGSKRTELEGVIARSLHLASDTSIGFARAVLQERANLFDDLPAVDLGYGGIPALARSGFHALVDAGFDREGFMHALDRLRGRRRAGRDHLQGDDLALLGIATGLASSGTDAGPDRRKWFLQIVEEAADPGAWSYRARQLAADLVDGAGRLRSDPRPTADALAGDLVLRKAWPDPYADIAPLAPERRQGLMADLLSSPAPADGELERAACWLAALEQLVSRMSAELVPDFDTLVDTLRATQSAFRRWVWDAKPSRKGVSAARWLIDTEAHVQSFLWSILEPRFGAMLVDEQYLPGFGQKQPRFDFGVPELRTIVEVKMIRVASDLSKIEEEIAGDLGLYFSELSRYDRMIVYIYDDSDPPRAEKYDTLRTALKQRDARIGEVVFVQRPGMIPPRSARN